MNNSTCIATYVIAATVICLVLCLTPLAQPAKTVNNYIFIKLTYVYIV